MTGTTSSTPAAIRGSDRSSPRDPSALRTRAPSSMLADWALQECPAAAMRLRSRRPPSPGRAVSNEVELVEDPGQVLDPDAPDPRVAGIVGRDVEGPRVEMGGLDDQNPWATQKS